MAVATISVEFRGVFFTGNPVGRFHRNQYTVLEEAGEIGVQAARRTLRPGHGYLSGAMSASLAARPLPARRGPDFSGRSVVIVGRQGFEKVRRYGRKQEKRFGYMRQGRSAIARWASANSSHIAAQLTEGLT